MFYRWCSILLIVLGAGSCDHNVSRTTHTSKTHEIRIYLAISDASISYTFERTGDSVSIANEDVEVINLINAKTDEGMFVYNKRKNIFFAFPNDAATHQPLRIEDCVFRPRNSSPYDFWGDMKPAFSFRGECENYKGAIEYLLDSQSNLVAFEFIEDKRKEDKGQSLTYVLHHAEEIKLQE